MNEVKGMEFEVERSVRQAAIIMIKQGAILLKLSGQVSATACSIFHRFFYRYSFFEHEPRIFAAASLFLAAKLEETPRKYKDVISVFQVV
jgi:cyclin L